jgi:hypothetical protein
MSFINKADLLSYILEHELTEITNGDDAPVLAAISAAITEARSYLFDTFDVDLIFAQTGTARNQLLVNLISNMAIYFCVISCQAGQYIDLREKQYNRAVSWFKSTGKTELYADLPRRTTGTQQQHIQAGSLPKRNNRF